MKCFVANLFAEGVNGNGIENKSNACQWKADWTIEPVFYIQYPEKKNNPLKLRLVNIFVTLARIIKAITEARKYENKRPGLTVSTFKMGSDYLVLQVNLLSIKSNAWNHLALHYKTL